MDEYMTVTLTLDNDEVVNAPSSPSFPQAKRIISPFFPWETTEHAI